MSKHSVKKSSSSSESEVFKQQVMNSSQEVHSCSQSETHSIKKDWPSPIVTVKANSFIPKINRQSEVEILKIGSPSQIRKAVQCNVVVDEPVEVTENNYKIRKVPTTTFEFTLPKKAPSTPGKLKHPILTYKRCL